MFDAKEYSKKWYKKNKLENPEKWTKWYRENPRAKYRTAEGKFARLISGAREREIGFDLTFEEFKQHFWQQDCFYCHEKIETVGIDRIDNKKGYSLSNLIPCCKICNLMRRILTQEEFIKKCKLIANFH